MAITDLLVGENLRVTVASGEPLSVREFMVDEGLSSPFEVRLVVASSNVDVDFEAAIGRPARFELRRSSAIGATPRAWGGICASFEMLRTEDDGLSTYSLRIVPELWLLTQRRNYRVFQDKSELDIALEVLGTWGIQPQLDLDAGSYPKRRFRVQYAETDFAFVSRLLEDIGVTYHFAEAEGSSRLVLVDAPNSRSPSAAVPFVSTPSERLGKDYVTDVRTRRVVRPGRYTQSDVDYRKALDYPLSASQTRGQGIEQELERYHHVYGGFLWKSEAGGGDTPVADDRGAARTDEGAGARQVQRRLEAQRVEARGCTFRSTAYELQPGMVMTVTQHPRAELGAPLLVESGHLEGTATGEWTHRCTLRFVDVDYRPEMLTPKPRTQGVESATVTGPAGEEIHTDEFGRIRVRFHWDREGSSDQSSSCWIPVSQPWAGAGFGALNLPRVGQEVIVDFLGADPDRPVVLGRVFTKTTPPPYELPKFKMVSGMRSESYPRPKPASGGARMGGGPGPEERATDDVMAAAAPSPVATSGATARRAAARPVGGGLGLEGLGAGEASAGGNASVAGLPTQSQPGIFGGLPAKPEEMGQAVERMQSLGPDGADHNRSANGLVFEDSNGGERVYLQGQRDLFMTVKHNFTASVGRNRAFTVNGNDYEEVTTGYQAISVKEDRTLQIKGLQAHQVEKDIIVDGKKSQVNIIKDHIYSETVDGGQVHQAKLGLLLRVGDKSAIMITPDAILIDSTKVYINPGADIMNAVYGGQSPEAAIAARDSEARIEAVKMAFITQDANARGRTSIFGNSLDSPSDQARRERELLGASQGRPNPATAYGRSQVPGATPAEIQQGAARAYDTMYVPQ